ncbi:MAG: hypothetical protein HYR55_04810 [Acidobacteria bacterium]|nr:hypothetical protein [Acidobacteriota bacterium]MBI3654980.1 hypothetical protein [Acidobacteriota bacterium]
MTRQEHDPSIGLMSPETIEGIAIHSPLPLPWPLPISLAVSGLYQTPGFPLMEVTEGSGVAEAFGPQPIPGSIPTLRPKPFPIPIFPVKKEELRLDVDGRYPLMIASGVVPLTGMQKVDWIAKLSASKPYQYTGKIWYKDPVATLFTYTEVLIDVTPNIIPSLRKAAVTFTGGGLPDRVRIFKMQSPYFHNVEFEYDHTAGITPQVTVATCAHTNHPPTLPSETLSIETVYRRAGFDATNTGAAGVVPLTIAGQNPDPRWSDQEMHDAMQVYWSRFANKAQWSMWTFFADQHEFGYNLGGIMFDDIGANERQGCAVFYNSFIKDAPVGDSNPVAWAERMKYWTAVHEMGHCFNLAHSWQKSLPLSWIPLANEPEAYSFMNYPYKVTGGQAAFFGNFEYRFSDAELLFMRHAPARFAEPGAAAWFDHHGFQEAKINPEPKLRLDIRLNRTKPQFQFMEPIVAELKLKNVSTEPQLIDETTLTTLERVTIVMKKDGKTTRLYVPYARHCLQPKVKVLMPGESLYESVFLSAGRNGFDLAEPGYYLLQAALQLEDEEVISAPITLRVAPPLNYEAEYLAQDFFSHDVGRVLAFDGSRVLTRANDTLREIVAKLGDQMVVRHARVALAKPLVRGCKVLTLSDGVQTVLRPACQLNAKIQMITAEFDKSRSELTTALASNPNLAAETFGHIDFKYYIDRFTDALIERGERKDAVQLQDNLYQTLSVRKVADKVLMDIKARRDSYQEKKVA